MERLTGRQWLQRWGAPDPEEVKQSEYSAVYATLESALDGVGFGASDELVPNDNQAEIAEQMCGGFITAADGLRKAIGDYRTRQPAPVIDTRPPLEVNGGNLTDLIIEYEAGEMPMERLVPFFQYLVDTGMVSELQGAYGRAAQALIDGGLVKPKERTA